MSKILSSSAIRANVLLLVAILPLFMPFGLVRGLGYQAILTMLTGVLAVTALILERPRGLPRWSIYCTVAYAAACLLSTVFHPSASNIFGAPLMRLGAAELLACAAIGLSLRQVKQQHVQYALYASLSALSIVSVPFTLLQAHAIVRVGGLLYQPDFLAVVAGLAFILGTDLCIKLPSRRWPLGVLQLLLLITILLTQTRAVLGILALVTILQLCQQTTASWRKRSVAMLGFVAITVGLIAGLQPIIGNRLADTSYASESTSYRAALQSFAVRQLGHNPLVGYGAAGVRYSLSCDNLHNPALHRTCNNGYYFDSSHNIFLDRVLGLGWLGGVSFVIISTFALWYGLRRKSVFGLGLLLIYLYFWTNASGVEIELLFWICLWLSVPTIKSVDTKKHKLYKVDYSQKQKN